MSSQAIDFNQIYRRYKPKIKGMMAFFQFSDEVLEDLIQEIFVAAFKKAHQLKNPEALESWLRSIARNHALRYCSQ